MKDSDERTDRISTIQGADCGSDSGIIPILSIPALHMSGDVHLAFSPCRQPDENNGSHEINGNGIHGNGIHGNGNHGYLTFGPGTYLESSTVGFSSFSQGNSSSFQGNNGFPPSNNGSSFSSSSFGKSIFTVNYGEFFAFIRAGE